MTTETTIQWNHLDDFRRSRSLAIDLGKALETVRDHCFLAGRHDIAAEAADGKRVLWVLVKRLNELLADESERAEGLS